jgi:hypothetical protein
MKYELEYRGVMFSVAEIHETPAKWRWSLRSTKVFGSINRIEGGQVLGTRAEAEDRARRAIESNARS